MWPSLSLKHYSWCRTVNQTTPEAFGLGDRPNMPCRRDGGLSSAYSRLVVFFAFSDLSRQCRLPHQHCSARRIHPRPRRRAGGDPGWIVGAGDAACPIVVCTKTRHLGTSIPSPNESAKATWAVWSKATADVEFAFSAPWCPPGQASLQSTMRWPLLLLLRR